MLMMKRNDTVPLTATLKVGTVAVDLEGATVKFHMRDSSGTVVVDAAATVLQVGDGSDGSKGKVKYEWAAGDTDTAGVYDLEWEVSFSDGTIRTFPTTYPTKLQIWGDIA